VVTPSLEVDPVRGFVPRLEGAQFPVAMAAEIHPFPFRTR
jgi:hypothetical protein